MNLLAVSCGVFKTAENEVRDHLSSFVELLR